MISLPLHPKKEDESGLIWIPMELATCPYCGDRLYLYAEGWEQKDNGNWVATSISMECDSQPDIESFEWDDWMSEHSDKPYVYWLPMLKVVERWLSKHYQWIE